MLDALVAGKQAYFVFKEQDKVGWAKVEISGKGSAPKESRQIIAGEVSHRTYSKATLKLAPDGKGIVVELEGSKGKSSVPLNEDYAYWEAVGETDK